MELIFGLMVGLLFGNGTASYMREYAGYVNLPMN